MSNAFWDEAIIAIFFFYGLAFYSMGLGLIVESGRTSELNFARSMRLLAGFGLLHGTHEWIDMFERDINYNHGDVLPNWLLWLRLAVLVTSFLALLAFGEQMVMRDHDDRPMRWHLTIGALAAYAVSCIAVQVIYDMEETAWRTAIDVLSRYLIGIPGSMMACWGLWRQRKIFHDLGMGYFNRDVTWAAGALACYGLIGQLFVQKSDIFPSQYINSDLFQDTFGFPVQLFRALAAAVIAIAMIRVLRVLAAESELRLEKIERAQQEIERRSRVELTRLNVELQEANDESARLLREVRRRDALRGELLQRITAAQEAERKRIARELHDGTGQMLTGLGLGLRGLSKLVATKPDRVAANLTDMETMAVDALGELRNLINDLRPPQLDDMGLAAALRFMIKQLNKREDDLEINLEVRGNPPGLASEVETSLFRIAQEGLTNVIKHAQAKKVYVTLTLDKTRVCLIVCDDGQGFDAGSAFDSTSARRSWGLIGMQERAKLINATLSLDSRPQKGTILTVCVNVDNHKEGKHADQDFDNRRPCGCPRRDENVTGERSEFDCSGRGGEWQAGNSVGEGAEAGHHCDGCDYATNGRGGSDPAN
jgi:signal transduction histidine kinase